MCPQVQKDRGLTADSKMQQIGKEIFLGNYYFTTVAPLVVFPVQVVLEHHSIFLRAPKGTTQFLENMDILCYTMDLRGFGHHSIKIATKAIVVPRGSKPSLYNATNIK